MRTPETDERTRAVQHEAGYRAMIVLGYLILGDIMLYGSGRRPDWLDWDGVPLELWGFLLAGGLVHGYHTMRHRIHSTRQFWLLGGMMLLAAAIAVVITKLT